MNVKVTSARQEKGKAEAGHMDFQTTSFIPRWKLFSARWKHKEKVTKAKKKVKSHI